MNVLILFVVFCFFSSFSSAAVHRVPDDFTTITEAVQAARYADTLRVSPGTYAEEIVIDRSINLIGDDTCSCILNATGEKGQGFVITVKDSVHIAGLTIRDGETGIFIKAGASLTIEDCHITGNSEDGIGCENDFNSTLFMTDCLISGNVDGIDLESTQGTILNSSFLSNRDDGLDYDGDAGVLVYGCTFDDNGDDGIEIRLAVRTHALILNSTFNRNGEDGLEIINSPLDDGIYNILCVQNCDFKDNGRYGVGFVHYEKGKEDYNGEMSSTSVYAVGNTFSGSGQEPVSPNYISIFNAPDAYPKTVKAEIKRGDTTVSRKIDVYIPLLVGIYNLRPTTDGTMAEDAEGVTVSGNKVYVADDNSHVIHVLDRRTGAFVNSISTEPFPGGLYKAPGPEGLDVTTHEGKEVLLLADDDGVSLYTLSLDEQSFGHVLRRDETSAIGNAEGVERVGNQLIFTAGYNHIYTADAEKLEKTDDPVILTFKDFGGHIAGVGADITGAHLLFTLSAYGQDDRFRRNHKSAFFTMDSSLTGFYGFWHLGPFSNDPRGICSADGLIYVADGRSDFTDEDTGEMYRGGMKVFVFMIEDDPEILEKKLPLFPLRCDNSK